MQCTKPIRLSKQGNLLVPCGKCMACRVSKAREWTVRIMHELHYAGKAVFITLTYEDKYLPNGNTLVKSDLQKFFKRLRHDLPPKSIKYYACGEYGEREGRAHYHAIVFGVGLDDFYDKLKIIATHIVKNYKQYDSALWPFGRIGVDSVTYDSARYVADYIQKKYSGDLAKEVYGNRQPPFSLMSLGLGRQYAIDYGDSIKRDLDITLLGRHVGIPRYYKKVLEIDSSNEDLVYRAQVKAAQERQQHIDKCGLLGQTDSIIASRRQAAKNLDARTNLKKKGRL